MGHDYSHDAKKYSELGADGSVYLAYRDLPKLLATHSLGNKILDFGCGTGRSTRFLKHCGYDVVGADIDSAMLNEARNLDTGGIYVKASRRLPFKTDSFDVVIATLVFMEYESKEKMIESLTEIRRVTTKHGIVILAVTSPEQYQHETTSAKYDYLNNENIKSGDPIKVHIKESSIIINDYYWLDKDYKEVFELSKFELVETAHPLGMNNEPYKWLTEKELSPWTVYVLRQSDIN